MSTLDSNLPSPEEKPRKKKASLAFQTYRNGIVFKKIRAESFDVAHEQFRNMVGKSQDRLGYYEIKHPQGRLIPIV